MAEYEDLDEAALQQKVSVMSGVFAYINPATCLQHRYSFQKPLLTKNVQL